MDFKIEGMYRHPMGFLVVEIRSYYTQEIVVGHNRYGSWMVGDPDAGRDQVMRDFVPGIPGAIVEYGRRQGVDSLPMWKGQAVNPFVAKRQRAAREAAEAKKKPKGKHKRHANPFINKAAKKNPLIQKLIDTGKI